MRRPVLVTAAVAAVLTGVVLAPAHAAVSPGDAKAKKVTAVVKDPAGDVKAVAGTLTYDGQQLHQGPASPTATTAADRAIDLRKVTYTVVRTGGRPALRITYDVKGPFSKTDTSTYVSFDGVETSVGRGYSVVALNDKNVAGFLHTGLVDKSGHNHACAGLAQGQPSNHVAVQVVPLACLNKAGIRTASLSSTSVHGTASQTSSTGGRYTLATDGSAPTRTLPLTPYHQ